MTMQKHRTPFLITMLSHRTLWAFYSPEPNSIRFKRTITLFVFLCKEFFWGVTHFLFFLWFVVGYVFEKVLWAGAGRTQNLCNAAGWWPSWLFVFGKSFAFVECCRVQSAASCQSRTWHSVFAGKHFYRMPNLIMVHNSFSFAIAFCFPIPVGILS